MQIYATDTWENVINFLVLLECNSRIQADEYLW